MPSGALQISFRDYHRARILLLSAPFMNSWKVKSAHKINLWRSNRPRLTHRKMTMRMVVIRCLKEIEKYFKFAWPDT